MTSSFIHPSLLLIAGALILPFVRGPLRRPYLFVVPLLALGAVMLNTGLSDTFGVYRFMDWELVFGRVDKLSSVFACIMALMAVIGTLYGLHVDRAGEHIAAWFYVAGSLGTIYSGDYLSLFIEHHWSDSSYWLYNTKSSAGIYHFYCASSVGCYPKGNLCFSI